MTKAYDMVSWGFTYTMLRRMGFCEMVIDMIWITMSNNWYSVIVNDTRCGFFQSTRRLKQTDPLAPSLFIIGDEFLSRMLNNFTYDQFFNGFYFVNKGPQINHLSFADDIIIFIYGSRVTLNKTMWILNNYEGTSGEQINMHKSYFMTALCALPAFVRRIQVETWFTRKESPLTYLGCLLYIVRMRIIHFNNLIGKVCRKNQRLAWQTALLWRKSNTDLICAIVYTNSLVVSSISSKDSNEKDWKTHC